MSVLLSGKPGAVQYRGRNSEFRLHREALDRLRGYPNATDATALYVTLQSIHGHNPAAFNLNFKGMKREGLTDLSRERFLAARRSIEAAGLLEVASNYQAGQKPRKYRLRRANPDFSSMTNVFDMGSGKGGDLPN